MPSILIPAGHYWLITTDTNDCKNADSINVISKDCGEDFFTANSFTPNGDFLNDNFKPYLTGQLNSYEFGVYNRWGELIFRSIKKEEGWDGFYKGKKQSYGAYIWYCKFERANGKKLFFEGWVNLFQ